MKYVLAGYHKEYRDYLKSSGLMDSEAIEIAGNYASLVGRHFPVEDIVLYGTWEGRNDLREIYDQLQCCIWPPAPLPFTCPPEPVKPVPFDPPPDPVINPIVSVIAEDLGKKMAATLDSMIHATAPATPQTVTTTGSGPWNTTHAAFYQPPYSGIPDNPEGIPAGSGWVTYKLPSGLNMKTREAREQGPPEPAPNLTIKTGRRFR